MKKNIFLFLFILVSIENVFALIFDMPFRFMVTKPFIVISLIAYYLSNAQHKSFLFLLALVFCLAGDVSLLFVEENELFFIAGLLAFLVGHVLYIIVYRQHQQAGVGEELLSPQKIRFAMPIVLAGTGLMVILYPHLVDLQLPVMVYAVVLMLMVITALLRYGKTSEASFWFVFVGASLFMLSDSLLAINKFLQSFQAASVLIMITYITAQIFIVKGILSHPSQKN